MNGRGAGSAVVPPCSTRKFTSSSRDRLTYAHDPRRCRSCSCCCSAMPSTPIRTACRPPCWSPDQGHISRARSSARSTDSDYIEIFATPAPQTETEANADSQSGDVQFAITIPGDFSRRVDPPRAMRRSWSRPTLPIPGRDRRARSAAAAPPRSTGHGARPERHRSAACATASDPAVRGWSSSAATIPRASHRLQYRPRPARRRPAR